MGYLHKSSVAVLALLSGALGSDILSTNGFSDCSNNSTITVNNLNLQFDRSTNLLTFDVSGTSSKSQAVTATLTVSAYGVQVYQKSFDPCDAATKVDQLCPCKSATLLLRLYAPVDSGTVPAGSFSATGSQTVPSSYASEIPSIAYTVPDLDGNAMMELNAKDGGAVVACVQSSVQNGKSVEVPAVSYVAVGMAAAALALSGLGAASAAGHPGSSTPSPTFGEIIGWFQGMAMNGMLSVQYPGIYRSFTKNFGFSTGLIPWAGMQTSIDNFRQSTGGNLTDDSYSFLKNATLVYADGSSSNTASNVAKRGWELAVRAIDTSVNGTSTGSSTSSASSGSGKQSHLVEGIQGYVEQLTIPQANTFMTVLLIFAIVVAAIAVSILLFKVILEAWALFASFPKNLTTFRKEYWMVMARTIVNLILLLYGVWVLYCIFQFTHGDSWAAKLLAGVTLGIFTAILGYYTVRIWMISRRFKKLQGDNGVLYEDKELWKKYKLFYADYKRGYWWLFIPTIVYMFAKGCVLAAGDGHGLVQTGGQLIIEALMLGLLLWSRPYTLKSGNWINIFIQIVRVLSVVCILVFVEELGISQTTKTITGVVLIAVQSALTGVLAILIAVNSLIFCIKDNPHRKRRKEAEKLHRDGDDLTSHDNRESVLMEPQPYKFSPPKHQRDLSGVTLNNPAYEPFRGQGGEKSRLGAHRENSSDFLVSSAASMGNQTERAVSRGGVSYRTVSPGPAEREPTLPQVGYGRAP
jgi:hypothetical protein